MSLMLVTNVDKRYEWNEKILEHEDFIESEDIIFKELCVEHEFDVSSSSLELADPTSLRFIELSLIHISDPRDGLLSRMPSSA